MDKALLEKPIHAGIKWVLDHDNGPIIEESATGIFLRDDVSGAYMLSDSNKEEGRSWLLAHEEEGYPLLAICDDVELADFAAERYGFKRHFFAWQFLYPAKTVDPPDSAMILRTAVMDDLPFIMSVYDRVDEEEMIWTIEHENIHFCLVPDENGEYEIVGFGGEHPEGGIGMLEILPEYRGRGYGADLERLLIAHVLSRGDVPFSQVEPDNAVSLALHGKLGFVRSEERIDWMF